MIPKIIHYCWFGGKDKPKDVRLCIDSWKKYLPEYKIIEWNENNFDVDNSNQYVKEAYKNKKWAFVSDYVRLLALYEHGGLYFDTDVEVFKPFDELLNNNCFFGFETKDYVASAVIGCEAGHELIKIFLQSYEKRRFIKEDGSFDITTNVIILTDLLKTYGIKPNGKYQKLRENITIFPQYYFSSNDLINIFGKYDKRIYAYHHCLASWYSYNTNRNGKSEQIRHYFVGKLRNILGRNIINNIRIIKKKRE